jgi:hypothetical protein
MKKIILFISCLSLSTAMFAQHYVENGGFEDWENEGTSNVEPLEWNSFKTADGDLNGFAPTDPVAVKTTDAHSGSFAVSIETVQGPFGIKVNGNLTCGRIHMGSTTAMDQSNHNHTVTGDSDFSQAITNTPDSLVAWIKYTAVGNDSALISSQVHDDYDFEFPSNAASEDHGIAYAQKTFATTNVWTRVSMPYEYTGLSLNSPEYVLINITSSAIPGGGQVGSTFIVDDIQLVYNELSIEENSQTLPYKISSIESGIIIDMKSNDIGNVEVRDLAGKLIKKQVLNNMINHVSINRSAGIYLVSVTTEKGQIVEKIFIK